MELLNDGASETMTAGSRDPYDFHTAPRPELPAPRERRRALRVMHSSDKAAVGRVFELDGTEHTFGRTPPGESGFDDALMSRAHARVHVGVRRTFHLVDLGARNGTYQNGRPVLEGQPLLDGDVICLGSTLLVVDGEPDPDLIPASHEASPDQVPELIGISFIAQRLRRSMITIGSADGPVLLLGATGSGKEVAAHAIHRLSKRTGPMLARNSAILSQNMAESALFGHKKGSYTGATSDRDGLFVEAHRGTLFLDEIGDLEPTVQPKLLRVLEDGIVLPMGGGSIKVDVRVIAATLKDVDSVLREDLAARLGEWTVHIPPLKSRRADILPLWDHFAKAIGWDAAHSSRLSPELAEALLLWDWPENVREVRKTVNRLSKLAGPSTPVVTDLPEEMWRVVVGRGPKGSPTPTPRPDDTLPAEGVPAYDPSSDAEPASARLEDKPEPTKEELVMSLKKHQGNISAVARALGLWRTQIVRLLERHGLNANDYR